MSLLGSTNVQYEGDGIRNGHVYYPRRTHKMMGFENLLQNAGLTLIILMMMLLVMMTMLMTMLMMMVMMMRQAIDWIPAPQRVSVENPRKPWLACARGLHVHHPRDRPGRRCHQHQIPMSWLGHPRTEAWKIGVMMGHVHHQSFYASELLKCGCSFMYRHNEILSNICCIIIFCMYHYV